MLISFHFWAWKVCFNGRHMSLPSSKQPHIECGSIPDVLLASVDLLLLCRCELILLKRAIENYFLPLIRTMLNRFCAIFCSSIFLFYLWGDFFHLIDIREKPNSEVPFFVVRNFCYLMHGYKATIVSSFVLIDETACIHCHLLSFAEWVFLLRHLGIVSFDIDGLIHRRIVGKAFSLIFFAED